MKPNIELKTIAKDKLHIAIEDFKQAEHEGAEAVAPHTHSWTKNKIYEDRKIILDPSSNNQDIEDAADDASAAAAQLLSTIRRLEITDNKKIYPTNDIIEKEAIDNLVNEGGPAT